MPIAIVECDGYQDKPEQNSHNFHYLEKQSSQGAG